MWNEFVQTVKGTEESRFATSRRSDQGRDLTLLNMDVDILEGMGGTIIEIKPPCFDLDIKTRVYHQDRFWQLGDPGLLIQNYQIMMSESRGFPCAAVFFIY